MLLLILAHFINFMLLTALVRTFFVIGCLLFMLYYCDKIKALRVAGFCGYVGFWMTFFAISYFWTGHALTESLALTLMPALIAPMLLTELRFSDQPENC